MSVDTIKKMAEDMSRHVLSPEEQHIKDAFGAMMMVLAQQGCHLASWQVLRKLEDLNSRQFLTETK